MGMGGARGTGTAWGVCSSTRASASRPTNGARTFDFLRGAEPYKYRFGAVDRWDRTWMVPRGPAGALLAARYAYRRS